MTAPTRAPAPTDETGALDWGKTAAPAPKPFPTRTYSTHILVGGFTFEVAYQNLDLDALEALVSEFERRGYMPAGNPTPAGTGPAVSSNGPPLCPNKNCSRYNQPMEPSQHKPNGFYCKGGKDPVSGNQKGYCKAEVNG